jgi:APA family basic amino acid/polyamine antiporter
MPPQRQIGLVSATALVVANMVGSGVFTTSGFLLADLHSPLRVLAAWLTGGVIAMLGAVCYGALARRFPESGGEYIFLARTLHPAAGYVAGWVSLLVGFAAPLAAISMAFGEYLKTWLPGLPPRVTGAMLLLLLSFVHGIHVQRGAWIHTCAVLVKLLLIAALLALAGARLHVTSPPEPGGFSIPTFAVSLAWISFSYAGWNAAAYVGSEVREPERNLPRAMALGAGLVTLLYLALNAVFVFSAPVETLAGKLDVARVAAESLGGTGLANFVTALIALALANCISAMIMAGPRIFARMADDGYLPVWLRFPQQGPPRAAILFQTAIALTLLWSATFKELLTFIGFALSLCTAAAVIGLIRLRWKEGPSLRVPGWPWVPVVFVAAVLAITSFVAVRQPKESAVGLATVAVGLVTWRFTRGARAP